MRKQLLSYKMGEFIGKNNNEQIKKPSDIGTTPKRNLLSDKERLLLIEQKKFAMDEARNEKENKKTKYHGKRKTTPDKLEVCH